MQSICYLIPVFNDQAGLNRSLESIAKETVPADIVVIDDGSRTPLVILPQFADLPGRTLTLIRLERNSGIHVALNAGLDRIFGAAYRYVARLDAGDTVAPDRCELQSAFLDQHPEVALVGSDVAFANPAGEVLFVHRTPTSHEHIRRALFFNNCLMHPAVMARVDVLMSLGGYDQSISVAEDYDLFFRIATHTRIASLPLILTTSAYAPLGISLSRRRRQQWSRLEVQLRYFAVDRLAAYLGVARTLLCMMVPTRLVIAWKSRRTIPPNSLFNCG